MPEGRVWASQYERHVNTFSSLFHAPSLAKTYAQLKDYCFCQGAYSNANVIDMEFFNSILAQDLAFFKGHLGVEIQEAFSLDKEKYRAIPLMRASHFDFFEVESRSVFGFCRLRSHSTGEIITAYTSVETPPIPGELLFGRLLPVGCLPLLPRGRVLEPFDTVSPDHEDEVLAAFQSQYDAFCQKFPGTSKAAFFKIAGYHVYELIQSCELQDNYRDILQPFDESLFPRIFRYTFERAEDIPDFKNLPEAKAVDGEIYSVQILSNMSLHETIREAILSKDGPVLEITVFLKKAADQFIQNTVEPWLAGTKPIRQTIELDHNAIYRALRHLYI